MVEIIRPNQHTRGRRPQRPIPSISCCSRWRTRRRSPPAKARLPPTRSNSICSAWYSLFSFLLIMKSLHNYSFHHSQTHSCTRVSVACSPSYNHQCSAYSIWQEMHLKLSPSHVKIVFFSVYIRYFVSKVTVTYFI